MFQVKICGITSPEDALLAAEAGADAIGLNFYEQSPRYVTPERAHEILEFMERNPIFDPVKVIGVTVNAPIATWKARTYDCGAAGVQFHGDEPPEDLVRDQWPGRLANSLFDGIARPAMWLWTPSDFLVIRAFRCRGGLHGVAEYLRSCRQIGAIPSAVLLDAHQPGAYGGTGQVVDWNVVRNERDMLMGLPVVLAGGLTPENVAEAIATARPDAVDVASGVESAPGKKDPDKVRRFVAEAKRAFAELAR